MGRSLFSQAYVPSPAARAEPEPVPATTPYEKWTDWNRFDPDADEFFESEHAVFEAFIDPPTTTNDEDEGSASPSPMAVGADDPLGMFTDRYANLNWTVESLVTGLPPPRQRSASVSVPARETASESVTTPVRSDAAPRTFNITPINIPVTRSQVVESARESPPPFIPPSPGIAASLYQRRAAQASFPPLYSWSRLPRPPSASPLPNPGARMSLAHITPSLVRVSHLAT